MTTTNSTGFATLARTAPSTKADGFDHFAPAVRTERAPRRDDGFSPFATLERRGEVSPAPAGFDPFAPCGR